MRVNVMEISDLEHVLAGTKDVLAGSLPEPTQSVPSYSRRPA
jgi:hypothetical protein